MDTLTKCYYCGEMAEAVNFFQQECHVSCECGASGPRSLVSVEDALEKWNAAQARPIPAPEDPDDNIVAACPFCGGKVSISLAPENDYWRVECQNRACLATGPAHMIDMMRESDDDPEYDAARMEWNMLWGEEK